ncbi:MAG: OmpA family protein [Cyclobacteriaceae bacterium]|nr:OmpA family protein [Cyclobacteriaceae bacterium]
MKHLVLTLILAVAFAGKSIHAQNNPDEPENFVVVIGAFASHNNAEHFIDKAKREQLSPQIELNKLRNLYYVYVMQTEDRDKALTEAKRLRDSSPFNDTWVFRGTLGDLATVSKGEDIHPVTEQTITPVEQKPVEPAVIEVVASEKPVVPVMSKADSLQARMDEIKKEVEKEAMVMKKGEMERLNHIYFYKDAAVLRPESRFEVDKLLRMLTENPKQKIRIHGHTNGNDPGKIIKRSDPNADFFSLEGTVEDSGSAKELSEQRALTIRQYLESKGIDKSRMTIKAWGGKKPLFKIDDEKAEANVRVEIEVVKQED